MTRRPDHAWEMLVRETHANPAFERGKLNAALKAIREAAFTEGLTEEGLAEEIRLRCEAWRRHWPHLTLTPTGLARNWFRIMQIGTEQQRSAQQQALDRLREGGE